MARGQRKRERELARAERRLAYWRREMAEAERDAAYYRAKADEIDEMISGVVDPTIADSATRRPAGEASA